MLINFSRFVSTNSLLSLGLHHKLSKLFLASTILLISLGVGIAGFMLIEDWNFLDALYMTVITIGTVGFSEVHELSDEGRIFTSFFIIFNLGVFALFATVITSYILEGELRDILSNYISNQKVKKLKNHVIVCGFGKNGHKACEEFIKDNIPFVVIEKDGTIFKEEFQLFVESNQVSYIEGDATQDEILKAAGVERASAIITTLPSDADNVFVSLTARQLSPDILIIARANETSAESKLLRAGANKLVRPDLIGGVYMANLIIRPEVVEFLDMISGTGKLKLEEFLYEDFKDIYKDKSILDLDIRNKTGASIMGFKDAEKGFMINPHPSTSITSGDIIIVLGTKEQIINFAAYYTRRKTSDLKLH
ncbi:MAG: potassium channel protein [Microscillaceae bacterium]|nr:potassium channel protein [Microscillaceae bacterium]